jgi:hypothetical protein
VLRVTDEELRDLTGYQRPSKQIAWLKRNGVRFFVAADGHPRVLRAHLEGPRPQRANSPNLEAVRGLR